jgi:hypothetical protein
MSSIPKLTIRLKKEDEFKTFQNAEGDTIILPNNESKLLGNVTKEGEKWRVKITTGDKSEFGKIDFQKRGIATLEDAKKLWIAKCCELGTIRNKMTCHGDYVEMCLSHNGMQTVFDKGDLHIVDKHIWYLKFFNKDKDMYVCTYDENKKQITMANIIMNFDPTENPNQVVMHISGDNLDNQRSNLVIVDKSFKAKFMTRTPGKSGVVGVTFEMNGNRAAYRSRYTMQNGERVGEYFYIDSYKSNEAALTAASEWIDRKMSE